MDRMLRNYAAAAALLLLAVTLLAAPMAAAKGADVLFQNDSRRTQYVLATYGGDGSCSEQPEREQLVIEPGESVVLESGDSKVCWCSSAAGKIGDCTDAWQKARPGSKKTLTF